jgi:hypothetical protein
MQPVPIHAVPFLVATLVKIVIGWLWYSPLLFLRQWQQLSGVTDEAMKGGMAKGLATWIIGALVMTFVLAHAVYYAGAHSALLGAVVGFMNWLGFILVVQLDTWAADKRPFKLVAINGGNHLVGLVLMGAILAAWT